MGELTTVLVTGASSSGAVHIIRALRLAGRYRVLAIDSEAAPTGVFAAEQGFRVPPPGADGKFAEAVTAFCAREQVRVVIPGNSEQALHLLRCQEQLQQVKTMLLAGSFEFARVSANKWLTHLFLEQHSFPCLRTFLPLDRARAEQEIGYPLMVKPCEGTGDYPAVKVKTPKELDTYLEQHAVAGWGSVLQEHIADSEGEYTASVILARAGGRVLATCVGRWLKTGTARAFEIGDFPLVRKVVEAQAQAARTRGPLTFQGRIRDGKFCTFSISPRFANPTMAFALAGFNEVDAAVQNFLTGAVPPPPALTPRIAVMLPQYHLIDPAHYVAWVEKGAVSGLV